MPCARRPCTYAWTRRATAPGSSPNERVLMIGLSGLLFRSASGAKLTWMPTARGDLEAGVVERGEAAREPGDDELADLLARRQRREQGIRRRGGGCRVRGRNYWRGPGGPYGRRAGATQQQTENQELMRAHHVIVLGLIGCSPAAGQVRPGIDVLLSDSVQLVAGKRVVLLTNHTGVDATGHRDVDRLYGHSAIRLPALFSPEHGFRGLEHGPGLPDAVDPAP